MSESMRRQRIGVFGGTFDPIHVGHLLIAEHVREALELDEVRFIPAATAPHKQGQRSAEPQHRQEMIELAIGGNPHFRCDARELRRGGTSYTVDTLAELNAEIPSADLFFLMGADSLAELHTWRTPEVICQLAFVAVLARGGQPQPDMRQLLAYLPESETGSLEKHLVKMPQIEISSSEIRARLRVGRSVRYQLHPATAAYIEANELYREP